MNICANVVEAPDVEEFVVATSGMLHPVAKHILCFQSRYRLPLRVERIPVGFVRLQSGNGDSASSVSGFI